MCFDFIPRGAPVKFGQLAELSQKYILEFEVVCLIFLLSSHKVTNIAKPILVATFLGLCNHVTKNNQLIGRHIRPIISLSALTVVDFTKLCSKTMTPIID